MPFHEFLTSNPYERIGTRLYAQVGPRALLDHYTQHVPEIRSSLPCGGQFLDVGSGPGDLLLRLAPVAPEAFLFGLDPASAAVNMSRKRLARKGVKNVGIVRAGIDNTSFEEDRFDVISSIGAYKHWPDRMAGLREVKRILKPGGKFFLFELDPEASFRSMPRRYRFVAPLVMPSTRFAISRISVDRQVARREIQKCGFDILEDSVADFMPLYRFVLTKNDKR